MRPNSNVLDVWPTTNNKESPCLTCTRNVSGGFSLFSIGQTLCDIQIGAN